MAPSRLSRRDQRWLLAALSLAALGGAIAALRLSLLGQPVFLFLVKNLALAAAPAALALALRRLCHAPLPLFAALGLGWLLFFPNAPYIVTDLIHLSTPRRTLLWMDVLILGSAALSGLVLAFASLRWTMEALARRLGRASMPTALPALALLLGALGVYFGRFARWNSWDVATRPAALAAELIDHLGAPESWLFTATFGACLLVGYWLFGLTDAGAPPSAP